MSEPNLNQDAPLSLEQKVAKVKSERDQWASLAADPSLSPAAAHAARQAYRSSAAAVKLGEKALAWQGMSPEEQELAKALGMPSFPGLPGFGSDQEPEPSTKPGTSSFGM